MVVFKSVGSTECLDRECLNYLGFGHSMLPDCCK
jgi:hypothetical protein